MQTQDKVKPALLTLPLEIRELILIYAISDEVQIQICACTRKPYYSTEAVIERQYHSPPLVTPPVSLVNEQLHRELRTPKVKRHITNTFIFCSWKCVQEVLDLALPRSRPLLHRVRIVCPERRYFPGSRGDQEFEYAKIKSKLLAPFYRTVCITNVETVDRQGSWLTVTVEMDVDDPVTDEI